MGFSNGFLPMLMSTIFSSSLSLPSTILSYAVAIAANLKWACCFLFHHSLFHHRYPLDAAAEPAGDAPVNRRYQKPAAGEEEEECAICLCGVEEGEEVKELRCDHLFHGDCFDRWVGYNRHATCPLCRDDPMGPRRLAAGGDPMGPRRLAAGGEPWDKVIVFNFCSLSSRDRDAWWVR